MSFLFNKLVTEGTLPDFSGIASNNEYDKEVDAVIEPTIESLVSYDCDRQCDVYRVEAAMAKTEAVCIEAYVRATTDSEKEHIQATFEASVSGAIAKIKEYILKAIAAIKSFLKKLWQHIKDAGTQIKAFFVKYGKLLKDKDCTGLKVKWVKVNLGLKFDVFSKFESAVKAANAEGKDSKKKASELVSDAGIPSAEDYKKACLSEVFPDGPEPKEVEFNSVRNEAIAIEDEGSLLKDCQAISRVAETFEKQVKSLKNDDSSKLALDVLGIAKSYVNILAKTAASAVGVYRRCAWSACRSAITYHPKKDNKGAEKTATGESFNGGTLLDQLMAEVM